MQRMLKVNGREAIEMNYLVVMQYCLKPGQVGRWPALLTRDRSRTAFFN